MTKTMTRSDAVHRANAPMRPVKLDNIFFESTGADKVNPNTHQKFIFCGRLHMAAGLALCICPGRPGTAS
jgi:hypothetical protein